jgi:hypothetical protein
MNKLVKCINTKSYSLTIGKGYILIEESQNFYRIKNDNNAIVMYGKSLFDGPFEAPLIPVAEAVAELMPDPIPEPVLLYNIDEIKANLNISITTNDDISFNDNIIHTIDRIKLEISLDKTISICDYMACYPREVSCGIYDITNINVQFNAIKSIVNEIEHLSLNEREGLINYIYVKCIANLILSTKVNLYNLSTNTDCDNYENIKEVIEAFLNVTSVTAHNPNSGNEIILWTINMS